ncbi:MAG: flagellar basal body-associated FliL family protein [Spirochaetales bacterium]|nr:flagellar basal body-associated FliL family protein [Leptospiraceae bacterium]MCP5482909.1 flagellar basal body-associated FliL family protein [Spirochaetales bacterium]MCP5486974.1 flagellar basal body-associated FliL family protein [Spirochaetales bacterium]
MADEEEFEEGEAEEGYEPTAASGLNKVVKILIYVALGAVGIVLMSVISYYVALTAASQQYREVASIAVVRPPPPTENFNFTEDFRVNTADRGEPHFIKLKLSLGFEAGNAALSAELAQRTPQLRNMVNLILMGKTKDDLAEIQDRLELQEEIKASINHILSEGKITDVYFGEFIVN